MTDKNILDDQLAYQLDPEASYKYAGFWIRVGAALIDGCILLPLIMLTFYNGMIIKSFPLMIVITLLMAAYKPVLEWKKSATLGKMALKLKLIDQNGDNLSLAHSLKRNSPWIISSVIGLVLNITVYNLAEFANTSGFMDYSQLAEESPISLLQNAFSVLFLIIIIPVIFDKRKQGLHDMFAGTFCIVSPNK